MTTSEEHEIDNC